MSQAAQEADLYIELRIDWNAPLKSKFAFYPCRPYCAVELLFPYCRAILSSIIFLLDFYLLAKISQEGHENIYSGFLEDKAWGKKMKNYKSSQCLLCIIQKNVNALCVLKTLPNIVVPDRDRNS